MRGYLRAAHGPAREAVGLGDVRDRHPASHGDDLLLEGSGHPRPWIREERQVFVGRLPAVRAVDPVHVDLDVRLGPAEAVALARDKDKGVEPLLFTDSLNFMKDGGVMTATFTQKGTAKDNPFYHQFHPNHDSLLFNNGKPIWKEDGADGTGDYETWSVTRTVTLKFQGGDPTGAADEDWNRTVCGGIYREEITGLNKTPIIVEGAFRLNKTLDTPNLCSGGVVP